ncbi:MAG: hypothetical protein IJ482_00405 [Alphaproteobacteria bacterium]|nr:hypothetical protein [Alphaproteobacteria bacterium]
MFNVKVPKFMPGPMLGVMLCLSSCAEINCSSCPVYPVAGPVVASELENLSAGNYPATWEWIGRIDKLRQQLELCSTTKGE